MSKDKSVSASFVGIPRSIVVNKIGNGTVVSSPAGIYCGPTCSANYVDNTTIVLTATGDPGYGFLSWTGCKSSIAEQCTVLLSSDNISPTVTFSTNDTIIYNNALTSLNSVYSAMSSFFGTPLGSIQTATTSSGTVYVQWYVSGTALLAFSDGYIYYYYNQIWYNTGITWKQDTLTDLQKATYQITQLYNQYPANYGAKTTAVTAYIDATGKTFYVQWFANSGLLAWSDGYIYYYTNTRWVYTGISWK